MYIIFSSLRLLAIYSGTSIFFISSPVNVFQKQIILSVLAVTI
jgi:hypothetical protein